MKLIAQKRGKNSQVKYAPCRNQLRAFIKNYTMISTTSKSRKHYTVLNCS